MKRSTLLLACITMGFCTHLPAVDPYAANPQAKEPVAPTLLITVDCLQTDVATANELIHGDNAPKTSQEWHAALQKLQAQKGITSLGTASVNTKSGNRAATESGEQKIYATEWDPAKGRAEHAPVVPSSLTGVDMPTATAFEARPVGLRFEVDPVLSPDGKIIDLNVAPELTRYFGTESVTSLPAEGGERPLQTTPRFYTLKVNTSVSVSSGGTALAGVALPPDQDGNSDSTQRVLFFISARAVQP